MYISLLRVFAPRKGLAKDVIRENISKVSLIEDHLKRLGHAAEFLNQETS